MKLQPLSESTVDKNPFTQFKLWYQRALSADFVEPTAVNLATCTPDGKVSSRMVLLKSFDEHGFVFYTNYQSSKGLALEKMPYAALNFWWPPFHQQVRIEGEVTKVSPAESDHYFASRPRGSQLSAHASAQSAVIENYDVLSARYAQLEQEFANNKSVPRPAHWGGYRVIPNLFEFWQGRPNRLHDRIQYTKQFDNQWKIERLAP